MVLDFRFLRLDVVIAYAVYQWTKISLFMKRELKTNSRSSSGNNCNTRHCNRCPWSWDRPRDLWVNWTIPSSHTESLPFWTVTLGPMTPGFMQSWHSELFGELPVWNCESPQNHSAWVSVPFLPSIWLTFEKVIRLSVPLAPAYKLEMMMMVITPKASGC